MVRRLLALASTIVVLLTITALQSPVANAQPVFPQANADGPYYGYANDPINFRGAGSAGLGLTYVWSFGDGTTGIGVYVSKAYANVGVYTVTLTVTDIYGRSSVAQTTASISFYTGYPYTTPCTMNYQGAVVCSYSWPNYGWYTWPYYGAAWPQYGPSTWPYMSYCPAGSYDATCVPVATPASPPPGAHDSSLPNVVYEPPDARTTPSSPTAGAVTTPGQQTPYSFR